MRYAGHYRFTITAEHVANPRTLGRDYFKLVEAIGRPQSVDIGKQVWETSPGVFQVENDEQRAYRQIQEGN